MQSFKGTKAAILQRFPDQKLNSTTITTLANNDSPIEVFPPEVFFKDIEQNQNYEVTVTIRNLTKKMRRIVVSQPKQKVFKCRYDQSGSVAAGLSMKLNIQFETHDDGSYDDYVEIHTEGYKVPIRLNLHALRAGPDIQFEPLVNLKFIPIGHEKSEMVEFKNEGKQTGHVTLKEEVRTKSGIIMEPSTFSLEPNQVRRVKIGLLADTLEVITKHVVVQVDGDDRKQLIEVSATCVKQQLSIVFEDGGGQKSSLNFGTIYMGERREYPAFLVNNGPQPAPFKFKFLQGLRNLDENHTDENETFVSPAEVGKELTDRVLTAEPLAGTVPPYSQIPINFICRTKKHDKKGGFSDSVEHSDSLGGQTVPKSQNISNRSQSANGSSGPSALQGDKQRFEVRPQEYASLAIIKFDQDGKVGLKHADLKVQMMARAQYPEVKINRQYFAFGECQTNDRRDMTLTIKNKNFDLPIDFCFPKISHFKANPAKGKLLPDMEHTINISFEPKNFGQYNTQMCLEILKGIYKIPITVTGNCTMIGEREKKTRGPAALTGDFTPHMTAISDDEANNSTVRETLRRKQKKPDPALSTMNEYDMEEKTLQIQTYLATKANKERATNFLKHQRINREKDERIGQKIKETQRAPPKTKEEIERDPDLGMDMPDLDLKFQFNNEVDPLYVEKPIGKYEPTAQNLDRIRAKKSNTDNRIVKKKFKKEPQTQAEIRDCQTELSGEQLQKISAGPQKINFKNVFVKSSTTLSFNISNDLRQHIYVRLMVDQYPELAQSYPLSQVIPPGQEAGFDIVFCSKTVKIFNAPITYYINDRPFTFLVQAQADPVSLELSKKVLKFAFPDDNIDMFFTQKFELTNNGNADAKFRWQNNSKIFVPEPLSGVVEPGKHFEVKVTFFPPGPKIDEENLVLKIEDGADEELRCQGHVSESKCAFVERQLDFGNVHVGMKTKEQTITLKNQMRTGAVFEVVSVPKEFEVFPLRRKVPGDQKQTFTVSFKSDELKEVNQEIVVNIRGGKQLRFPVKARAIVPDIYIEEPNIDFQGVTIGDQKELPLTIVNNSDITAKLILDIRDYPEFEIIPPDASPDDDVHSEIMLPYDGDKQTPAFEDIAKMNPDDIDPGDHDDESSEDDEFNEEARRYLKLSIRPSIRPFQFKLRYTPSRSDDPKNFILPIKVHGWPYDIKSIQRRITAVGEKPRFYLDPTVINFKTKVIAKGQKPLPFHNDIQISNPDPNPVKWRIDRNALEGTAFSMNPTEGILDPGIHSTVRVTFNPHDAIEYVTKVPLFLDDETEKPYLTIEFRGQGAEARIFFDRREIILPPVPLDIETRATFWVCHNGYENQELHCKIASEVGKLPLEIRFPDGKNLGVTKSKVKVEASFKFNVPLSFTTFIDFIDDEGKKFQIPISGTTDNSIFTNFSFIQRYHDEVCLKFEPGKPIKLDQDVQSDDESAKTGGKGFGGRNFSKGASSVMTRTNQSLLGYAPIEEHTLMRNCQYITKWFTTTISAGSMQKFPEDVVSLHGAPIFDLIFYLSGKKPPGQATTKMLQQAQNASNKESLGVYLKQYEELINFLKVNGAHLNTVRPEYLLSPQDYLKFTKINPREENWKQKSVERFFMHVQAESWITIFYQILRIYYLNRVTPKNFKTLPGMPSNEANVETSMTKSNVYSVSETILLKWMQFHYNQINPMHPKTLTNFDNDLHDSTVFAALIRTHYGEPDAFKDFRNIPTDKIHFENNAKKVIKAINDIGIITHISYEDIVEPSAREMMLFCVQLYQALPHYIPKATIEFPAVLGDLVTKNIELSNPSKQPISYHVSKIGSSDYSIEQTSVRIEPGQTIPFPIRFQSRISKVVKGKIIFTNRREGNVQAAAMVFELMSNVYERNSVDVRQVTTKLYKAATIELPIDNAFEKEVLFNVQVHYEKNQALHKGKKDTKVKETGKKGSKDQAAQKQAAQSLLIPEPFTLKNEQIKIGKGKSATLHINFLPFELGVHKCNIILTDENVGEVQYTIIGKAELPEILDTFSGDCSSEEPFTFVKTLNFRNEKLEQARNQLSEKDRKDTKSKRDGVNTLMNDDLKDAKKAATVAAIQQAQTSTDPKIFEIEISNPFFSGPQSITLFDQNIVKAQAAAKAKDGKVSSQNENTNNQNILELNSNPQKPAIYTCYVILKSTDRTDIRLYEYKLTAIPQKIKAQLEFRIPAREIVAQDIPIVNNSSSEWKVSAVLSDQTKGQLFTLARDGPPLSSIQKIVKKQETGNITLFFKPQWVCNASATLTLKNESTKEEYEYELKGIGEEPLAIDHVVLNCKARETKHQTFEVKNQTDKPVTYTVWTDLQNAVGTKEFTVKPRSSYDYRLAITPLLGGVYTASITFQDSEERFMWWTVEVRTDSPKPSQTIDLRTFIRKATAAELSLNNPLNDPITFEVFYQGEGLIGDPTFSLEPKSVGTYNLIYSPLAAGSSIGNIGFLNEKVGEFWYDLNLTAEENPITNLTLLECELGKNASHTVDLENPTGKELYLDFRNSNPSNFEIIPDKIVLPPYELIKVQIQYSPTTLDVIEQGNIIFDNPSVGKWEFNVEGKGLVPTMMEPQPISTSVGSNTSSMLSFKNPFKEPATVNVHMEGCEGKIFSLLLKRNKFNIGPLGILQIPYSFSPETMTETKATIVVSMSKQLVWKYPIRGIAESASTTIDYYFRTRSRRPFQETLNINLPGFTYASGEDTFSYEINVANPSFQSLIDRAVFIEQKTDRLDSPSQPLVFDLRFEPLRPFKTQTEFIIYKSSGGRWKFNVVFEALEPDVDDIITIASPLHKTSSVSFKLTNHLKAYAEFTAFFTADSAVEFVCHPKSGLLEPYGKEGTNFIVSFTPTEYGKTKVGKLVIQTEEMQWTYEIRGSHPQYKIPQVLGGRIQNKLSKEIASKIIHKEKKNFLRDNLVATKYGNSPERSSMQASRSNMSPKRNKTQ